MMSLIKKLLIQCDILQVELNNSIFWHIELS